MDFLFFVAENERRDLRHPYVGTEHLFLAYLEIYGSDLIDAKSFKESLLSIIGSSNIDNDFGLYTPKVRSVRNKCDNVKDVISNILLDNDSIAYNVLNSISVDIDKLLLEVENSL